MAADGIIFYVPRESALVKPVDRFGWVIRQNACFGSRTCLPVFRNIHISVFTPKIAKNWGIFNAFPMENKNANNFWTVSSIITKFVTRSQRRTPKVQYAQNQCWKCKVAAGSECPHLIIGILWHNVMDKAATWTSIIKRLLMKTTIRHLVNMIWR